MRVPLSLNLQFSNFISFYVTTTEIKATYNVFYAIDLAAMKAAS